MTRKAKKRNIGKKRKRITQKTKTKEGQQNIKKGIPVYHLDNQKSKKLPITTNLKATKTEI